MAAGPCDESPQPGAAARTSTRWGKGHGGCHAGVTGYRFCGSGRQGASEWRREPLGRATQRTWRHVTHGTANPAYPHHTTPWSLVGEMLACRRAGSREGGRRGHRWRPEFRRRDLQGVVSEALGARPCVAKGPRRRPWPDRAFTRISGGEQMHALRGRRRAVATRAGALSACSRGWDWRMGPRPSTTSDAIRTGMRPTAMPCTGMGGFWQCRCRMPQFGKGSRQVRERAHTVRGTACR